MYSPLREQVRSYALYFRTLYNPMDNAGHLQLAALIVALMRQAYRHARVRFWPKGVGRRSELVREGYVVGDKSVVNVQPSSR
ncbi:hypothetical protein, partial [Pseudomonas syringae]|uniref:hypothetical protein n=1 Tax=Pseudomonas syringae TaxID=317 RepID=UPI001F181E0A